ncbi:MAG TPA: exo-alpha-sialidase [Saprospiraceae bacterium]|mgnify:CR=1 FL=1|nr:exo-alpha-sialidase [Saprospiraceae bacterium]HPN68335.1 exo-alpha-sialidase [Saprospiraceae bacterium]
MIDNLTFRKVSVKFFNTLKYANVYLFLFVANISFSQNLFETDSVANKLELVREINSGQYERDFAMSPTGDELFYTLQSPGGKFQTIIHRKKGTNGIWSEPQIASFAGHFSDLEPTFAPDGKRLYFVSNRPTSGKEIKDFDIWYIEKVDGIWKNPINLGAPINTAADEFYPSITNSGNIYFTAAYNNAISKEDIFVSTFAYGKYNNPVALDSAVNSKLYEFNAFVSPDEDYIIFTSYGRKDDMGRGDLYMSLKDEFGHWQQAKNLQIFNSDKLDYCPFVSFDKKTLYFTSERNTLKSTYSEKDITLEELLNDYNGPQNGNGDIYRVSFEEVFNQAKKQ